MKTINFNNTETNIGNKSISMPTFPIPHMTDNEAMTRFGSDKPGNSSTNSLYMIFYKLIKKFL